MNAFRTASLVESRGLSVLLPWLEERSYGGRLVHLAKGRLAEELQREVGDLVLNTDAETFHSIEVKCEEENRTGNLFLETWSNRKRFKRGWLDHCNADWLLYYFLGSDELYRVSLPRLKQWALIDKNLFRSAAGLLPDFQFKEKCQGKYNQLNDTWGVCVPIPVLKQEVGLKRIEPGPAAWVKQWGDAA
jgi:hypothetical protein